MNKKIYSLLGVIIILLVVLIGLSIREKGEEMGNELNEEVVSGQSITSNEIVDKSQEDISQEDIAIIEEKNIGTTQSSGVTNKTITGIYYNNFEGTSGNIRYFLTYPESLFIGSDESGFAKIVLSELGNGNQHLIQVFWNEGAGFGTSIQFWNNWGSNVGGGSACNSCVKASASINIPNSQDILEFTDSQNTWIVFRSTTSNAFVIARLKHPSAEAKDVLKTLVIRKI